MAVATVGEQSGRAGVSCFREGRRSGGTQLLSAPGSADKVVY